MKIEKIQLITCPFEEYLAIPAHSHSSLRADGKAFSAPTIKMQIGTKVDNYLTEPHLYNHEDEPMIRACAIAVRNKIGGLWKYLKPQMAFTAYLIHGGFKLFVKGRADLAILNRLVIDIKATQQPISKGIEHFGYDNAISNYCLGLGAKVGLILTVNPKNYQTAIYNVPLKYDWWEYQILQKGEPI